MTLVSLSFIFIVFFIFIQHIEGIHLNCVPDEIVVYEFATKGEFFSFGSNNGKEHVQEMYATGDVALHCMKSVNRGDKDFFIWWMHVSDVERGITTSIEDTPQKRILPELSSRDTQSLAAGHIFAQSRDGKLIPVLHESQDESPDVSNLKKAILQLLQTRTDSGCSDRDLTVGTVQLCYKKSYSPKEERFIIQAEADVKDIKKKAPFVGDLSAKYDEWKYTRDAVYDSTARLVTVEEDIYLSKGTAPPTVHNVFKENDLDETHSRHLASFVNARSETSLVLSAILKRSDKPVSPLFAQLDNTVQNLRTSFGSLSNLVNFVQQNADYSLDQLAISVKHAAELELRYKKQMEKHVDFWQLFGKFKSSQSIDDHTFSKLRRYISIVGVDHAKLFHECYGALKAQHAAERNVQEYHLACQSLLIADQEEDGQDYLLQTMKLHKKLLNHGLVQCLHLHTPIPGIVRFLVNVQKRDTFVSSVEFSIDDATYSAIRDQSYLVLAGVTRNLPRDRAEQLLNVFLGHLRSAQENGNEARTLLITRALQNLGGLVPWQVLHSNALNENFSEEVQQASAEALCSHTDETHHNDVTAALSHIALNAQAHPNVRAAAVLAQLTREQNMPDTYHGSARDTFKLLYQNPQVASQVHASVEQYLHHDASHEATRVLTSAHEERRFFDSDVYEKAVEHAISGASSSPTWNTHVQGYQVNSAEVNDLTQMMNEFKSTFRTAIKENAAEQCVDMNASQEDKICMHDAGMVDFLQHIVELGNLDKKNHPGRHLKYEKYCGVEALNMFSGFVGGVYKSATNPREFSIFSRGTMHMSFFKKEINVMSANMYLVSAPSEEPAVFEDNLYLRLKDFVLLNTALLTEESREKAKQCERDVETLVQLSWSPLFSFEISMGFAGSALLLKGSVDARFSHTRAMHFCSAKSLASIGAEPVLSTTAFVSGAVTCASDQVVRVSGSFTNRMQFSPKIGFKGNEMCVVLDAAFEPLHITAEVSVSANGWKQSKQILNKSEPSRVVRLHENCSEHVHFN